MGQAVNHEETSDKAHKGLKLTTMYTRFIVTALFVLILPACSLAAQAPLPTETPQPATSISEQENTPTFPPTPATISAPLTFTSMPVVLADTFFTGCAFLDKNANGQVDSNDAPIGAIQFTVTLSGGMGFGNLTSDKDGCALVIIPGALPKESWPIIAQMEIPQIFPYVPIGETRITLAYPDVQADFLFSQP